MHDLESSLDEPIEMKIRTKGQYYNNPDMLRLMKGSAEFLKSDLNNLLARNEHVKFVMDK